MAGYEYCQLSEMARVNESVDAFEEHAPHDPDDAVQIGTTPRSCVVKATLIDLIDTKENASEPVFCGEAVLWAYPGREKSLRLRSHPTGMAAPTWRAMDVQYRAETSSNSDGNSRRLSRWHVVVATFPYSTDWVECAQLKPSGMKHKSLEELDGMKRDAIEHADGFLAYLKDIATVDLFETRSEIWTASLAEPNQSPPGLSTGRCWNSWGGGRLVNRPYPGRPTNVQDVWVFGACRDPAALFRRLSTHAKMEELRDRTQDGSLFEHHHAGSMVARQHQVEPETMSYAEEAIHASIAKALAGPAHEERQWIDERRSVADLVENIYVDTLYNLNRRVRGSS